MAQKNPQHVALICHMIAEAVELVHRGMRQERRHKAWYKAVKFCLEPGYGVGMKAEVLLQHVGLDPVAFREALWQQLEDEYTPLELERLGIAKE
jgi:hypothetical protein